MPELPEVETIRRDLDKEIAGKKIKSVEVTGARSTRRHEDVKTFIDPLVGRTVKGVDRRGKYMVVKLDGPDVLIIHLGMSGQLLRAPSVRTEMPKHTHVVINFTQGGQLRFIDPRTFGEMFVTTLDVIEEQVPELAHLGIDALSAPVTWKNFGGLLTLRSAKLKTALMDQRVLAGIGNIYSDEILFHSGLRFDRSTDSLKPEDVRRLYRSTVEVLQEALRLRGSSLADAQYVDLFGKPGGYQAEHQVYARDGLPCRRCRQTITKEKFTGRTTYFCPACQI
ncbi:unannotated protein [freshwater metagenome]|uniref:Unannotated protein n=1 Tax=freshwater metagenome TaxID=449393 RepID=A0A6J7KHJ0_9ZZZZ|nr:bifunctional DNA-formamidopyrimidine glycosylase/DNA-(apurinic or apyrimidinic site) lyase [Acidimicrobiia bacterium]